MEYDEISGRIEYAWACDIESRLPKLNDFSFNRYNTKLNTHYNAEMCEYILSCSVDVIHTYHSDIKISRYDVKYNPHTTLENAATKLSADLSKQITGKKYIEINGIKYYPENECE